MKFSLTQNIILVICILLLSSGMTSCLTYKQIVNFQDGEDLDSSRIDSITNAIVLRLQPDDVLQINISSYEAQEAAKFNMIDIASQMMNARSTGGSNVSEPFGYRVDTRGNIDMPVIGQVYVKDLTLEELRDLIYKKVEETGYLKELSVQVRYVSFRITILGEVNAPGVYTITNNKLSILDAVGLAKDVSVFSNRDNILIIREEDGKRTFGRIDLKTKAVFQSPYYYLQPNDIVYVEPHKSRILGTPDPVTRYVGTIIALGTLITLLVALF